MRSRSPALLALSGALLLATTSAVPTLAQGKAGGDDPPVTLQLAIADSRGRQSEQAALDLVDNASRISGGSITIEPTFEAGTVADLVTAGTYDLGILPSRDWDAAGVTSLDAFEAPFLVDNDALALAISTNDIAKRAMGGLDAVGVTGLALWPEDLRHLFAFAPSGKILTTPAEVAGSTILVVAGVPGHDVITALGGTIYAEGTAAGAFTGSRELDADSGALTGMVTGLWGAGLPTDAVTVAGDEVLYAKYQMLVANTGALGKLTDAQRADLDQAVLATQAAALGRHFTEADLAAQLCEAGATVIAAGPDALAAMVAATAPVTAALEQDPVTKGLIADIGALKAATPASPGAGTCSPPPASPAPSLAPSPAPGAAENVDGYIGSQLLPNGSWRATITRDDLLAKGMTAEFADKNAATITWTLTDGTSVMGWDGGNQDDCMPTYSLAAEVVRIAFTGLDGCTGETLDVVWKLDGNELSLKVVGAKPAAVLATERAWLERTWTKID